MMKRKTIMILFTAMLLTQVLVLQPTLSKVALNGKNNLSIQSAEKPIIPSLTKDAPTGTEKIKANVFEGGDCEESAGGIPFVLRSWKKALIHTEYFCGVWNQSGKCQEHDVQPDQDPIGTLDEMEHIVMQYPIDTQCQES